MLHLLDVSPVPQQVDEPEADQNLSPEDNKMSAEAVRTLLADSVCPTALSHYMDTFLDLDRTNSPLVLYVKDAAKSQMVRDSDELDTHGVPFKLSVFSPSFRWSGPWSSVFCLSRSDESDAVSDDRGWPVD